MLSIKLKYILKYIFFFKNKDMKYLGFKLHPSFEFKDSMPSNEYIKVNSLLFNPAYEINKNITGNKKVFINH